MKAAMFIAAVSLTSMLPAASQAIAQTTLRLAENQPEDNPVTIAMHRFAELVNEKTDGEVNVQVYANAQLGQESESIEQAQAGIIDLARVNTTVLANVSPSMGVVTLPYIFSSQEHKYSVLDGEIGDQLRGDLEALGLVAFDFMEAGTRNFYFRDPVSSIEDLSGAKIRVQPAEIPVRMTQLLGASPTPMNYGEVYSSLQTGVIDGAENDYVSYLTSGHYEVAPYLIEDGHLSPPAILLMNLSQFNNLSPAQQEAIRQSAHEAALFEREEMFDANEQAKQTVIEAGVKVTEVDFEPFQKAIQPIYDEYENLLPLIQKIQAMEQGNSTNDTTE